MPESIIPIISLIIGAAGVGTSIYEGVNKPGAPKPAAPNPAQVTADANKTKQNQEAALSQQFPGIQAATGGSLSPEAWIRLSELLTGKAGEAGIDSSAQDLLKKFSVGAGSGGSGGSVGAGLTPVGSSFG